MEKMGKATLQTIPTRTYPSVQNVCIQSGSKLKGHSSMKAETPMDPLMSLCRVCASYSDDLIPIFGEDGKHVRLANKINENLPITVSEDDQLPTSMCQECIDKLDAMIAHIKCCVNAQLRFAEILVAKEKQQIASAALEAQKKNKLKAVLLKMKNNGKLPGQEQNDQILKELDSNPKSENNQGDVTPKEVFVEQKFNRLNKNISTSDQNLNIDDLGNHPFEIESGGRGNEEISITTPCEPESTSEKDDEILLEDHSFTFWNQKPEGCEYCTKTFVGRVNLIAHQMKEHKSNVFYCFKCDQVFYDSKEDYDKHVQAHHTHGLTSLTKAQQPVLGKEVVEDVDNPTTDIELKVVESISKVNVDEVENSSTEQSYRVSTESECEDTDEVGTDEVGINRPDLGMKPSEELEGTDYKLKNLTVGAVKKFKHGKESESTQDLSCPICECKFMHVALLDMHFKMAHNEHLPCHFCTNFYSSDKELQEHEDHCNFKSHECELCGEHMKSRRLAQKHEFNHFGQNPHKCFKCNRFFFCHQSLLTHLRKTHPESPPFLCDQCGEGFMHMSNLNAHKRTHSEEPSVTKAYSCTICGKTYSTPFLMREHMHIHTGNKTYICVHCRKKFYKRQHLQVLPEVHCTDLFKCGTCGIKVKGKINYMRHKQHHEMHENRKQDSLSCRVCGEVYPSFGLLLRHWRSHRKGEVGSVLDGVGEGGEKDPLLARAFKCETCGKLLASKLSLKKHVQGHNGELPFKCSHCDGSFLQRTSLVVHECRHTGELPYSCKDCGKSFRSAGVLKKHSLIHLDNKFHSCEYCTKQFRRKDALQMHLHTHTSEWYGCRTCGCKFAQKCDAEKHEHIHVKGVGMQSSSSASSNVGDVPLGEDSNSSSEIPLSLVEITMDLESTSATEQSISSLHSDLQLEHGIPNNYYSTSSKIECAGFENELI